MSRIVEELYGKLFMGTSKEAHYYVKFIDSDRLEFVSCADISVPNYMKVEFDQVFAAAENLPSTSGLQITSTGSELPHHRGQYKFGSKDRKVLSFIERESKEVDLKPKDGTGQMRKKIKKENDFSFGASSQPSPHAHKHKYRGPSSQASPRRNEYKVLAKDFSFGASSQPSPHAHKHKYRGPSSQASPRRNEYKVLAKGLSRDGFDNRAEDSDAYESSFINDATPSEHSTPPSTQKKQKAVKRKRIIYDSDEESDGGSHKVASTPGGARAHPRQPVTPSIPVITLD